MCAEEPRPKEPYESEPGLAFASATSSSKVFAGTEACTAMTAGKRTSTVIGVKLFRPLYGMFLKRKRLYEIGQWLEFRSVVFFFQAEDGIRDWSVTGVQTCAL